MTTPPGGRVGGQGDGFSRPGAIDLSGGRAREVAKVYNAWPGGIGHGRPLPRPPASLLRRNHVDGARSGKGGRNQEWPIMAALALDGWWTWRWCPGHRWHRRPHRCLRALASALPGRARAKGMDRLGVPENNDAYPFFRATGDLLLTGPRIPTQRLTFILCGRRCGSARLTRCHHSVGAG
jgi:hydroxypyruvate reductase